MVALNKIAPTPVLVEQIKENNYYDISCGKFANWNGREITYCAEEWENDAAACRTGGPLSWWWRRL